MADIDWPTTLPAPLTTSFRREIISPVVSDSAEVGKPRLRKRFTRTLSRWSFTLRLTGAQRVILENFVFIELDGGAYPFNWTHPVTGDIFIVSLPPDALPGESAVSGSVFGAGDGLWDVSVTLEQF